MSAIACPRCGTELHPAATRSSYVNIGCNGCKANVVVVERNVAPAAADAPSVAGSGPVWRATNLIWLVALATLSALAGLLGAR